MDWQTLGAVGEFAGALLVAVSLIYLAGQVRLANRISRAEAFRNVTVRFVEGFLGLGGERSAKPVALSAG